MTECVHVPERMRRPGRELLCLLCRADLADAELSKLAELIAEIDRLLLIPGTLHLYITGDDGALDAYLRARDEGVG